MRRHLWILAVLNFALGCDGGELPDPPPPPPEVEPQLCAYTDADRQKGIGEAVCANEACARCFGGFNDNGATPVAPEGCIVHPGAPIERLCVNDCAQCD